MGFALLIEWIVKHTIPVWGYNRCLTLTLTLSCSYILLSAHVDLFFYVFFADDSLAEPRSNLCPSVTVRVTVRLRVRLRVRLDLLPVHRNRLRVHRECIKASRVNTPPYFHMCPQHTSLSGGRGLTRFLPLLAVG